MLGFDDADFPFKDEVKELTQRRANYAGAAVSVKPELEVDRVIPVWPKIGHACVTLMLDHVDAHLQADLKNPGGIPLPEAEWPKTTPKSKVYASDDQWYRISKTAFERNIFVPIHLEQIFRNQFNELVLQGAMGVDRDLEQ